MATQVMESAPAAVAAQIAGTPAGTVMTPEYVTAVARMAYVWGWPLVSNLNRSLGMSSHPAPGRLGGDCSGFADWAGLHADGLHRRW